MNRAQAAGELSMAAATDHGLHVSTYAGVHLVDVRSVFPSQQLGRTMALRARSLIQFVSEHHDAAFYADDPLEGDDFAAEMQRLRVVYDAHLRRGFGGIGYHTYGFPSGRIYLTGDFTTQRANVAGRNHQSLGHCSAGRFMGTQPPIGTQLAAALAAIAAWGYLGRMVPILSHKDVALIDGSTACPGDTAHLWVRRLPEAIAAIAPMLR